jgi:indole-3-glycerol phosphate synthase
MVPQDVLLVAESGISSNEDLLRMARAGAHAVLIGEILMRAPNRRAKLSELRQMALAGFAGERNGL